MMLNKKLVIVSGKGGVGKSAVSVALALRAQRAGIRVLVAAMIDEIGASIHLGADKLAYEPSSFTGGIDAMVVERGRALEEYIRVQMRVPPAAPLKTLSKAMQVLVDTAPGIREVISMGKPIYDAWQDRYDLVIVDAPPLGQLMSYLRAPEVVAKLVPTGGVKEQAQRMADFMQDPEQCSLVLVTTPEELPAIEATEALAELEREPVISVAAVLANRVLPGMDVDREVIASLANRPATAAAMHHLGLLEEQREALQALPIDVELPYLFGIHTPTEVAALLADSWEDAL